MWVEYFRPVLIVLQLLGFSFGYAPAPSPRPHQAAASPARPFAWTPEARSDFIETIGGMIALEGVCRLRFDQTKLAAFIEKTVPASDFRFIGDVNRKKRQVLREATQLAETEKTLLCLQMSRAAKSFDISR